VASIDRGIEFVGSFPDPVVRLTPPLPEIGFLGRSNVGKSSLLNAVAGRRIARTSATPGKTQHLNVFRFPEFYLIDLPGYGYAKRSLAERRRLQALVHDTVARRRSLAAMVWLLDIRHPLSRDDLAIRELLVDGKLEVIVALTKSDKLSRARALIAARERAAEAAVDFEDVVMTSATKPSGIAELRALIEEVVASPRKDRDG
jgi:GTP-binding protein